MAAPNQEYLELNHVQETATGKGNNTRFVMENLHNGSFRITDGFVGIKVGPHKPKVYCRPMSEWDETYESKISRGYLLTKTKKMEQKEIIHGGNIQYLGGQEYEPLTDEQVTEIICRLTGYANNIMEENFTVKVDDISDEMIEFGKTILEDIALNFEHMSVAEFNNKLKVLYAAIPRRIDKLSDNLAQRKLDFNDIVANEQELYDVLISQIKDIEVKKTSKNKTILEAYGLEWRCVTPEEEKKLVKMLESEGRRYVKAWRITNKATEDRFNEYCKAENLTDGHGIDHLFHGSRNENFWSIITNGLTINPTGVVITGKAYGNGTYFAPAACKSMGYTSRSGSKWAVGTSSTGFLGVYKVATGKRYDGRQGCNSQLNYKKLQDICPGAHCTWAEARWSGFMMDEVIVYQDQQSTIEYLVEVGLGY